MTTSKIQNFYDMCNVRGDKFVSANYEAIPKTDIRDKFISDYEEFCKIKTFDELCEYYAKIVIDKATYCPTCWFCHDRDWLYELVHDKYWIRDVIYQLNKNGFLTDMSQPGDEYETFDKESTDDKNFIMLQRALVSGYMKKNDAYKLYEKLKNDNKLIIMINEHNDVMYCGIEGYERCTIMYEAMPDETKKIHKPFTWFCIGRINEFIKIQYIDCKNYIGVGIMAKDFNDNSYLWKIVLDCIQENNFGINN